MTLLKPLSDRIDASIHPSARHDPLLTARHRAFIAPRLIGSSLALVAFPAYVAVRGVPSVVELTVFAALLVPLFSVYYLSRSGRFESAHMLYACALTALITVVAAQTGGIGSYAAVWLVVIPLEAALSASRRVVTVAAGVALGAAGLLLIGGEFDLLPSSVLSASQQQAFAAVGVVSALLYASGLGFGAESLARIHARLLLAKDERYQWLTQHVTEAVTRHAPNGAVVDASPAAGSLFGADSGELLGHGLFDRVHVADRPAYLTALSDTAVRGENSTVEFRLRRSVARAAPQSTAEFIWVAMNCYACRPAERRSGASAEVIAVMRNVSEQKALGGVLAVAHAKAEQASVAKNRFLATMSHELRTPLNVIIGFSEMLMNEQTIPLDAARRAEYAKLISNSGHHLLSVVNGILDMSKIDTGEFMIQPEPFAPGPVIAMCADLFCLKASTAGVDLRVDVSPDLPEINADKRAVKQILINLVSNAVKFTDKGGRVSVTARACGPTVEIVVEDTGIGMSPDDLAHVGDPFFQARNSYDRAHDGTGLGMSIVKGLVALHGGQMMVRSRAGEGTCVTVRLPIDCENIQTAGDWLAVDSGRSAPIANTLVLHDPKHMVRKRA